MRPYKFEETSSIIRASAFYAFPHIFHSCRSSNDREVTNPKTREICRNNISEIGYLLKNISAVESENLKYFTIEDLNRTHYDNRYININNYIKYADILAGKEGRFGTRQKQNKLAKSALGLSVFIN